MAQERVEKREDIQGIIFEAREEISGTVEEVGKEVKNRVGEILAPFAAILPNEILISEEEIFGLPGVLRVLYEPQVNELVFNQIDYLGKVELSRPIPSQKLPDTSWIRYGEDVLRKAREELATIPSHLLAEMGYCF